MVAVGVMQVPVDQVVDVIAVGHRLMPAARAVHVVGRVRAAAVVGRAAVRVDVGHLDAMLLDHVALFGMVEVPIVQVVDVILVLNGDVAAVWTMLVATVVVMIMKVRHKRLIRLESDRSRGDHP